MTTMTTKGMMNGVDTDRLSSTIEAIEGDASLARFQFRATNRWLDGGHNRSTIRGFRAAGREDMSRAKDFVFDNDEPDALLGQDRGANPVEFLLHGLAGCMTTTMVYHAAARGIKLDAVESSLEGDIDLRGLLGLDASVRPGYQRIRVSFRVKGNLSEKDLKVLAELTRFSPVYDTVLNPVPVTVSVDHM